MYESTEQIADVEWLLDSPFAMESYLATLESERTHQQNVDRLLAQIRRHLASPTDEQLASAEQVRDLFARYQGSAPPQKKLVSQMVADMREE